MATPVIYPYKREGYEFELRFSLRSLANMAHGRVIVAGDASRITSNLVEYVPNPQHRNRYLASTGNIVAAIERLGISGDFILMNDDFFMMRRYQPKLYHRGRLSAYLQTPGPRGSYRAAIERTLDVCKAHGVDDPLFYGLHAPVVMDAQKLCDLVREFRGRNYLLKSLYFNLHKQPSTLRKDAKLSRWAWPVPNAPVLSTSDRVAKMPEFRRWLASQFPAPSPYEIAPNREQKLSWR
jgi:hypothetical protein